MSHIFPHCSNPVVPHSPKSSVFSTPEKQNSVHFRHISYQQEKSSNAKGLKIVGSLHQKALSMVASPKQLEEKIKKLEESIEKNKNYLFFSPKTNCSYGEIEEMSIGLSYSSDESLNIIRKQVESVKRLSIGGEPVCKQNIFDKKSNLKHFSNKSSIPKEVTHKKAKSFANIALFQAITVMRFN
jgi:hypothetical protein